MLNNNKNNIHFTSSFKYLGTFLTPDLTEDAKIEARINKASSQLGILKHFFNCKDVDRCVKYWVYLAAPLNTLLWGAESWNLTEHNRK